jgi:hypothetical protein
MIKLLNRKLNFAVLGLNLWNLCNLWMLVKRSLLCLYPIFGQTSSGIAVAI